MQINNGYELAWLVLTILSLGIYMAKHGQPREEKYNFFTAFVVFMFELWLLYMAGLFR
jgi:hypothetical protein